MTLFATGVGIAKASVIRFDRGIIMMPPDEWEAYDSEPYENPDDYMDEADE